MLTCMLASAMLSIAQAPPPPAATAPVDQRPSLGPYYLQPITESDIARFAEILKLAAPQRLFLDQAFERYRLGVLSLVESRMRELGPLSRDAAEAYLSVSAEAPTIVSRLNAEERKLTESILRHDSTLLAEVESVLADDQKSGIRRLHLRRTRHASPRPGECRFFLPDLSAFVEMQPFEAEMRTAIDPILAEYETVATPMFVKLHREWATLRPKCMAIEMARGDPRELSAKSVDMQRDLNQVNHGYADRLAPLMPKPLGRAFLAAYRSTAGCAGFPDPLDPRDFIERLAGETRSNDVDAALSEMWQRFEKAYEATERAMVQQSDDMFEWCARTFLGPRQSPFVSELQRLRTERWDLSANCVRQFRDVLQPVPGTSLAKEFDEYFAQQQSVRATAEGDRFPGW